jgi:hypothetical protein
MTQEEKELLLKDLCARLPYGVKLQHVKNTDSIVELYSIDLDDFYCKIQFYTYKGKALIASDEGKLLKPGGMLRYKPYLFPLSSMTDEMLEELNANGFFKYRDTIANVSHLESKNGINEEIYTYIDIECISFLIEYFHSHHIDYKGFIEKNLAIDATGLNIY